MSLCLTENDMAELTNDSAPPAVLRRYRRHLESCSDCRKRIDSYVSSSMIKKYQVSDCAIENDGREENAFANLRRVMLNNPPPEDCPPATSTTCDATKHVDQSHTMGPYRIICRLGVGGMGTVQLCHDSRLDRLVAIKTLHTDRDDERSRRRFVREAQAAARIHHENVVSVHNVAEPADATPYLEMQYIPGESLRERLFRQKILDPEMVAAIAIGVGRGLSAAHAVGLVHRDVKPANVMLDAVDGRAKLTDFGLVRASTGGDELTREGLAPGTPEYMSPEQFTTPGLVDARTDVYSLGVTLYEMLTGTVPFRGASHEIMQQVLRDAPPSPRKLNVRIPRDLATICLKALEKDRERRYDSASDFADDLQRWQEGEPILARTVGCSGRFLRWWKRQPALAAVSTASVILAISGISAVLWQWRRAEHNLADFIHQRRLSTQFLAEANRQRRGKENKAAEAFVQSRNADEARGQLLSVALQSALRQNTNLAHVERKFEQMFAISEETIQSSPKKSTDPANVASAYMCQGNLWRGTRNFKKALASYEKALSIFRKLLRNNPDSTDTQQALAATMHWTGCVRQELGDRPGALTAYHEAEHAFRQLCHRNPDAPNFSLDLAQSLIAIARLDVMSNRDDALKKLREARGILLELQRVVGEPFDLQSQRSTIIAYRDLADGYRSVGDTKTQVALYRTACHLSSAVLSGNPRSSFLRSELAAAQHRLGLLLLEQGQPKEAITELQTSVDQQRKISKANLLQPSPRAQEAVYLGDLGRAFRANGQYSNAIETALSRRSLTPWDAELLYQAATDIGRCLSLLPKSNPSATAEYLNKHTTLAIDILQEAIDVGFHDKQRLETDPALDKLRQDSQFASVLKLKPRKPRHQQLLAKTQRPNPPTRRTPVRSSQRPARSVHSQRLLPQRRSLRPIQKHQ